MPAAEFMRQRASVVSLGPFNSAARRPSAADSLQHSPIRSKPSASASSISIPDEKPVATGNGVSMGLTLTEPTLFLQGFDPNGSSEPSTVMLRGSLHLKVSKSAKIKAVTLKFSGTATTRWPEGIPPKRIDFEEVDHFHNHTWTFFNASFPTAEHSTGADHVRLRDGSGKISSDSPYLNDSPNPSSINLAAPRTGLHDKRLSLQHVQSRSFEKGEKPGNTVNLKGYKTFHPGDYIYNFEHAIDSRLPETINVDLGSVKYQLEASVERAGAFKTNLVGVKEVEMIRAPSEGSLEQVEPIAISRNWEDQLHYDIVISGKSFPLGAKVPIAFKLTPLAKVQCHRIKVFVTENTEYFCSGKRVHRMEPTRKVLLFEKRADSAPSSTFPGSSMCITAGGGVPYDQREAASRGEQVTTADPTNLLGRLSEDNPSVGPTEMEINVQLPGCKDSIDKDKPNRLHFDTTHQNIKVHHWIKIVMRLSKPDAVDPTKRRHFEISIDSPFHILSCRATLANTALPAYTSPDRPPTNAELPSCSCNGAPMRRISPSHLPTLNNLNAVHEESSASAAIEAALPRPEAAHVHNAQPAVQRPIHMLRAPSFNPPAFEDEEPPPPLVTPPPQYNDIASPGTGLADYFSRLAEEYDSDDDQPGHGRVTVPLTPGSRVNRSMDLQRTWVPLTH